MIESDLDTLLSVPLAPADDAGFSARVARRIGQQAATARESREIIEWAGLLLAAAIFLAIVPLASLTAAIETVTLSLSNSFPAAAALAALLLTAAFARNVVDRAD